MASILSSNLAPFVKLYFQHPFFSAAEIPDPYLRLTYAYSDFTRLQLEKRGELQSNVPQWHVTDRICPRSVFKETSVEEVAASCDQGLHVYYNVNLSPRDFGALNGYPIDKYATRARSEHVTNCLFIPVDWDSDLPYGPVQIFREIGILPVCVVQSSMRGRKPRYQALVAVSPSDSREYERWVSVTRNMARVVGADPSSAALNKLFRLPGSVNWKEFEKSKKKDFSLLVDKHEEGPYPTYSLAELETLIESFEDTEVSRLLIAAAPPKYKDSARIIEGAKYRKPRLVDITWEEALIIGEGGFKNKKGKVEPGRPVVEKGERHTALISWAGALANEVGRGLYDVKEAEGLLTRLCNSACAWSVSERDAAAQELRGAAKHLRECVGKDSGARVKRIGEFLEGYAKDSEERRVKMDKEGGSLTSTGSKVIIRDTSNQSLLLQEKLNEFTAPLKTESPEDWINFLALFFREIRRTSDATGHVHDLIVVLMDRAEQLHLLQDIGFFLPSEMMSAWGEKVNLLRRVSREQLQNYCAVSLERLLDSALVAADALKKSSVFGPVVKKIKKAAEEEARVDSETVDEAQYEHLLKLKLQKYFDLKLTSQLKRVVVDAWTQTITAWAEDRDARDENCAVFQNGVLRYESGEFSVDKIAWRKSRYALHASFIPSLQLELQRALNGAAPSSEQIEKILVTHIPRFAAFMRSAFPDDVGAWVIMLRIVGYSFIVNNPFDAFFSFYGESGAGKGTMWRLIQALIGGGGEAGLTYTMDFLIAAQGKGGFVKAVNKLAVNIDEAESTDPKVHERVFRQINMATSGQEQQLEEKWEKSGSVKLGAKFIFTANKPFLFDDTKGAIERRMVALHFAQIIMKQDPNLLRDILGSEANKIATVAATLCARAWVKGRRMFDGARATEEGKAELVDSMNPVKGALRRFISAGKQTDSVPLAVVVEILRKYSASLSARETEKIEILLSGGDIPLARSIVNELKRIGYAVSSVRVRVKRRDRTGNKAAFITGIKLNTRELKTAGISEKSILTAVLEETGMVLDVWN